MTKSQGLLTTAALAALMAGQAAAGAFELREGSASTLGAAMSNRSSGDRDVSFALHNPAALRGVQGLELSQGLAVIHGKGDGQYVAGSSAAADGLVAGFGFGTEADPNELSFIPSFALGYRLTPRTVLGLTVNSPFGLATEYDNTYVGAFDATRSEMTTINVTPMIAYDPVPGFTIAAGVEIQYAKAKLNQRVGIAPGLEDGGLKGDGFSVGAVFGVLADVSDSTTLGAVVHTGFDHSLDGEYSANVPLVGGNKGAASFNLPTTVSVGLTHRFTEDFRMMAEFEFTAWSQFDAITIDNKTNPLAPDQIDEQQYKDSFMFALGGEYDLNEDLTLRAGLAYDQTPTTDSYRTLRTPDGDRVWASMGLSYEITDAVGLDFGYTYLHMFERDVVSRGATIGGARFSFDSNGAHIVGLNIRSRF